MNSAAKVIKNRANPPVLKVPDQRDHRDCGGCDVQQYAHRVIWCALLSTRPASLPYAMIDPVKVIAPMKIPRNSSTRRMLISTGVLCAIIGRKVPKITA